MAEAAIAVVSLGASVFICEYIDEIKRAPKELQQMLLELKNFEAGLRSFQTTLDNAKECVDVKSLEEQICRALNLGNAAIQGLRALVEKHAHNGKRDWWKKFKVAKKKSVFIKYPQVSSYARKLITLG
ncbi:hypothetical protein CJF30_00011299 [Rutstroemia sp. NJR-2017a BBW]|nr:hypothetical protein CJF30_00011299 [Rutstroemia sp. NJR-2017a BBW]